jgi:hypothetical protein
MSFFEFADNLPTLSSLADNLPTLSSLADNLPTKMSANCRLLLVAPRIYQFRAAISTNNKPIAIADTT